MSYQLIHASAHETSLPDKSVHMICCSPPYLGLRCYEGEQSIEWPEVSYSPMPGLPALTIAGCKPGCKHEWADGPVKTLTEQTAYITGRAGGDAYAPGKKLATGDIKATQGAYCLHCGGWRGGLGAEPTPEMYIGHLMLVMKEMWRILRDDGTCFVNLGDAYSGSGAGGGGNRKGNEHGQHDTMAQFGRPGSPPDIPAKNLLLIPYRFALAAQADGWYVRSDLIWHKKAPMPESVTDRCTKAHEYIYMLSKREKYYFDSVAIQEPSTYAGHKNSFGNKNALARNVDKLSGNMVPGVMYESPSNRNKRSVWSLTPSSFPGAHFACVDEETECLTVHGWKKHGELMPGILAAQFDMETQLLSWAEIEDVARYSADRQDMVSASSRDITLLLTPNHRTIIARRHPRTRGWQPLTIIEAKDLKPSHGLPASADWVGGGISPVSEDWAELIGWYITEGFESTTKWAVEIYQSKSTNPEKVARIEELLNLVGAEYLRADAKRVWNGEDTISSAFQVKGFAATFLRQWAPKKQFHESVLLWSKPLLTRLFKGLIDGDGHNREDDQRLCFIQQDPTRLGIVQAIGVRLGYATKMSKRNNCDTCTIYFTNKRLISLRGTNGVGTEITTAPYTGIVWCPKLPKGTWVARKNGRMFITGNTFPIELPLTCIKAGTSEYGVCSKCLAPYERVVEKIGYPAQEEKIEEMSKNGVPRYTAGLRALSGKKFAEFKAENPDVTTGWQPTCQCSAAIIPATVLDCFNGSGTSGRAAMQLGRSYIGVDISQEYISDLCEDDNRAAQKLPKLLKGGDVDLSNMPLWAEEAA